MTTNRGNVVLICSFLWILAGQGNIEVSQQKSIQVTLINESTVISCSVSCTTEFTDKTYKVTFFKKNQNGSHKTVLNEIHSPCPVNVSRANIKIFEQQVTTTSSQETGIYYCEAMLQESTVSGKGTFVLVREKGFQEPPPFMGFRYALVSVCVCLGIFSIVGTAFLLWRGNVYSYMRHSKNEKDVIKDKSTTSTTTATATKTDKAEGAVSFYMSLNPQEAGIYNVIEQETPDLKKKKINDGQTVQPHKDAHSRNDSSKPGGSTMEKKKIQVKPKPGKKNQEEVFESVYENL